MNVALISTANETSLGSMARYERLVLDALAPAADVSAQLIRLPGPGREPSARSRLAPWLRHHRIHMRAGQALRELRADVIHILDGSHAYVALEPAPAPVVITVHDLIPHLLAKGELAGRTPSLPARWLIRRSLAGLHRAARLIAVSRSTAHDVVRRLGVPESALSVIYSAVTGWAPSPGDTVQPEPPQGPPSILHVGHNAAYKNRAGVVRIFARVRQTHDVRLVLAVAYGAIGRGSWTHRRFAKRARDLYGRADAIISLGSHMSDRLVEAGADPARVTAVHNWVPGECVQPLESGSASTDTPMTVMYSGNIGLGHDLDTLIAGAATLAAESRPSFVFVGGGKREGQLRSTIAAHSMEDCRFEEAVPLDRLSSSLARADVLVVAQHNGTEGLIVPSKIYSALAAARPVLFIGPEECEVADIIRAADAGFIVAPGDADGAAAALRTLGESARLRADMGARGLDHFQNHLGRSASLAAILDCLGADAA